VIVAQSCDTRPLLVSAGKSSIRGAHGKVCGYGPRTARLATATACFTAESTRTILHSLLHGDSDDLWSRGPNHLNIGKLDSMPDTLMPGTGCEACRNTGYRGRIGICELLPVGDAVRGWIQEWSNASQIRDTALEYGMRLVRDDGNRNVIGGGKTIEEVGRFTVRATK